MEHPKKIYFIVDKNTNVLNPLYSSTSRADIDRTIKANEWEKGVEVIKYNKGNTRHVEVK
jgi:hypothetical protein